MVARGAARLGIGITALVASALALLGRGWDALALTLTAAVGIINTFWLEGLCAMVLQPGKLRISRRAAGVMAARFALWGVLFVVLYLLRRRLAPWAVAAGLLCYLVALGVAALEVEGQPPEER